jgi:glycosyltransferase involved in cell wall biosynthesis
MRTPELLFVSQTLPYPPDSGVNIRTFHILKALAREFPTRVLAFWRRGAFEDASDLPGAARTLEEEVGAPVSVFPIPMEWSLPAAGWVHARSVIRGRPFTHYAHSVPLFFSSFSRVVAEREPRIVHLDSLDLSAVPEKIQESGLRPKVVCTHHNVESALLGRRAEAETSLLKRAYLRRQAALYAEEERRSCPAFDLNIAVSERDAEDLRQATGGRFTVIQNGVDLDFFRPDPGSQRAGVVFVGGGNWFPNRDALEFFCSEILGTIREELPEMEVTWVGRCSEEDKETFWSRYRVRLTGYVEDVRPHLRRATCLVVPLRVGGGTRLKVTTAWAAGIPVVGTSMGVEGLEGRDGEHFLVEDDPRGFAEAVVSLQRNPHLWRKLAEGGRRIAERSYGWAAIGRGLCERYRSLL